MRHSPDVGHVAAMKFIETAPRGLVLRTTHLTYNTVAMEPTSVEFTTGLGKQVGLLLHAETQNYSIV
jgi:hypothetical protein